jgi:hypothetical protein
MAVRILRGLSSTQLACGCSIGIYETYAGAVIGVVDARHPRCAQRDHREGRLLTCGDRGDPFAAGSIERAPRSLE